MESRKQSQSESLCLHGVWHRSTQLRRNAFRHGRDENGSLFFGSEIPLFSSRRDTGMQFIFSRVNKLICNLSWLSLNQQEKLQFDDGFVQILQPIHAVVGLEFR
jgi:hypothetical protein